MVHLAVTDGTTEWAGQAGPLDAVLVPAGGGLIAGIASYFAARSAPCGRSRASPSSSPAPT